eukprot:TRINITY_DN6022_c0_g3_i3.p1 TRINITY_DN6022_c0_g3~~TRINITY_DN6022_c0_g3_i3.p1  ORF type:complete len:675 (+),score=81.64 TRINITY_DN6022_c0_g3_i3:175-2025(+)
MPGVNEGLQGRVAQPCELRESQMLVSQPSLTATPGDTCSTPNSFKMLEQLVEQLRCELALASSFREETQAQLTMIFNRQLEVLMRLERLDPTHRTPSGNDPVSMYSPFLLRSEQSLPSERDNEQSASFARDVISTVCAPLPELKTADHEDVVINETTDKPMSIRSTGTKKTSIIHGNSPTGENMEQRRQPSPKTKQSSTLGKIKGVVRSVSFNRFIAFLVLANVANLGIVATTDLKMAVQGTVRQRSSFDAALQLAFLIAFSIELGCNVYLEGRGICSSPNRWMYCLDFVLITLDLADAVVYYAGQSVITRLSKISILRMLRLLKAVRLMRVLKVMQHARGMRLTVLAIVSSVEQLAWTMCLLVCIIYGFAVFFAMTVTGELSSSHGTFDQNNDLIEWWGSLDRVSLTLFQSISGGVSWIDPFQALHGSYLLQATFILYLSFVLFAVLNVITGVVCNTAIEMASRDTDMVVAARMEWDRCYDKDLRKIFHRMAGEESDNLTFDQWEKSLNDQWIRAFLTHMEIEVHDVTSFFSMLDKDTSNSISLTEFMYGCNQNKGSAMTLDINLILKKQQHMLELVTAAVRDIHESLGRLSDGVATERGPCDVQTFFKDRQQSL